MKPRMILLIVLGLGLLFGINYVLFTGALQGLPPAVEDALVSDATVNVTYANNLLVIEPVAGC